MITSSQNPKIKLVRSLLGRAKDRREAGAFVVEGVRLVEEAVGSGWEILFALYTETLNERGVSQVEVLRSRGVEIDRVTESLIRSTSETETSQGILAVLSLTRLPVPSSPNFILIPDRIRDPGNLGTLLRSADATGVQAILLPPDTTDAFAPKVVRAAMGAHFRLPIHSMTWEQIEQMSKSANLQMFLADMDGPSCWDADLRQPLALIIGGEAEGGSNSARSIAGRRISIPMMGPVESLNAGVAGSVLMYEVLRQRTTTLP